MFKKLPKIKTSLLKNKINSKTKNQSPNLIYNSILCISLMQFRVLVDKPVGGKEQNEMKQHKYKTIHIYTIEIQVPVSCLCTGLLRTYHSISVRLKVVTLLGHWNTLNFLFFCCRFAAYYPVA